MCSCSKCYRGGEEKAEPRVELRAVLPVCARIYLLLPHVLGSCSLRRVHISLAHAALLQTNVETAHAMRTCIRVDYPHRRALHWLWHHVRSACIRPCLNRQSRAGKRARQRRRLRRSGNKVDVDIAAHGWGGTVGPWCGVYDTRSSGLRIVPTRLGTAMMTSGKAAYKGAPLPH
jgi:hypothetical protein